MEYIQPYGKPAEVVYGDQPFVNGDPSIGRAGSIPPAEAIEHPQREIVNIIRAAFDPGNETSSDLKQLAKAIMSGRLNFALDTGVKNQLAGTLPIAPDDYYLGMPVRIKVAFTNAGDSTLALNGLTAKQIVKPDGTPLTGSELLDGMIASFSYSGNGIADATGKWIFTGATGQGQIFLTAPVTYYVNDATGNDAFDGLSAAVGTSPAGPFKTLQRASNAISKFNLNGYSVTVNVADGTYAPVQLPAVSGQGLVSWIGNIANPQNVVVSGADGNYCFASQGVSNFVNGFKVTHSGTVNERNGFSVGTGSVIGIKNIEYGAVAGAHHRIFNGGQVRMNTGIWRITGGASGVSPSPGCHVNCEQGGRFDMTDLGSLPVLTLVGTPAFAAAFLRAVDLSIISFGYSSLSGSATGLRYSAVTNSVINTGGGGASYVPGNAAGTTASGGQYL